METTKTLLAAAPPSKPLDILPQILPRALHTARHIRRYVRLTDDILLAKGRIHEIEGPSADGFAACVIAATSDAAAWIGRRGDIYSLSPHALRTFFDPARLILTECLSRKEILWAAEQSLRMKGFECVILQLGTGPSLRESRRLQLAAEEGQTIGLVMIERGANSSAAQTRWHCAPLPSPLCAANDHQWRWECTKNKSGVCRSWDVRWRVKGKYGEDGHAAGYVDMVS